MCIRHHCVVVPSLSSVCGEEVVELSTLAQMSPQDVEVEVTFRDALKLDEGKLPLIKI
jgi:hypothetical protein